MFKNKRWLKIVVPVFIIILCAIFLLIAFFLKDDTNNGDDGKTPETSATNEAEKFAVTFYSDDGTILKIDSVKENSSAIPPSVPAMTYGKVFKSWDTDFSNITKDMEVHPVCEDVREKTNVIAAKGAYVQEDKTAVVPIQLCGEVCVSGLDITIRYDEELLSLKTVSEDQSVVYNDEIAGMIRLNYISAENTIGDVDLCNLRFYVKGAEKEIPITVEINEICAFKDEGKTDELIVPESSVINGTIFMIN